MLLTNLPDSYSDQGLSDLYSNRWQIEESDKFFKRSLGGVVYKYKRLNALQPRLEIQMTVGILIPDYRPI